MFETDLAIAYRNGSKYILLLDDQYNDLASFEVGIDFYQFNGELLSWDYAQMSIFHIAAVQMDTNTLSITLSRFTGESVTRRVEGSLAGFHAYAGDMDMGTPRDDLFINNMAVVPEPATLGLIGLGSAAALIAVRRRRM